MSKSWGNVVDPVEMLQKYSSDTIRYFLLRETTFGADFAFSEQHLQDRHDSELAANLGNLARRTLSLAGKYCDGKGPAAPATVLFDCDEVGREVEKEVGEFQIQKAIAYVFGKLADVNKWVTEQEPWNLKDTAETQAANQAKREGTDGGGESVCA